jgi:Putative phage tail protein
MALLVITAAIEVASLIYRLVNQPPTPKPPLSSLQISNSQNGAPRPFSYGSNRYAGQIIWTSGLMYVQQQVSEKGGGGPVQDDFYASFAVAFGEGPATIRRIWGDTKLIYDSDPTAGTDYPIGDYPAWSATQEYNPGNQVAYNGQAYECLVLNTGQVPTPLPPGSGTVYWAIQSDYPPWDTETEYNAGDVVSYGGQLYVCIIGNTDVAPPSSLRGGFLFDLGDTDAELTGTGDWGIVSQYYGTPTVYVGDQLQTPDPLIQGAEGASVTPAFRGTCYAVFNKLPLQNFGNRIPNLRAEVVSFQPGVSVINASNTPQFTAGGTGYSLYGFDVPPAPVLPWPSPNWVFARCRNGSTSDTEKLSIWFNQPALLMRFDTCVGDTQLMALLGILGTPCPYSGPAVPGNLEASPFDGITYDVENIGFQVSGAVTDTQYATYPYGGGSAGPGPLTLDAVTFPAPGADNNLVATVGGQLYMMKFPALVAGGADLYVAVVSGYAMPGGTLTVTGWTLAMRGTYMHVFTQQVASSAIVDDSSNPPTLASVVTDICLRTGLAADQIDVSLLTSENVSPTDLVEGYVCEQPRTAADILKVLMQAYFFDACETGGTVKFVPRGLASALTIPEADLGLVEDKAKLIPEEIGQSQDLPQRFTVTFNDPILDYQQSKQMAQRNVRVTSTKQQTVLSIPMTMDESWALQVAEKALYLAWLERFAYTMHLWRAYYLLLDPTDVVEFVYEALTFMMRVTQNSLGAGYATELQGVSHNPNNYLSTAVGAQDIGFLPPPLAVVGPTQLWLFDIPLLQDGDANPGGTGFYFAMSSLVRGWAGALLEDSTDDENFSQVAASSRAVTFGYTTTALPAPRSPWTWDNVNTLTVKLSNGAFAGDTPLNVLNGTNALIVGGEVIQFTSAVQIDAGVGYSTWILSGLLRGRRGTELACGTHATGEIVIALLTGMQRVDDALDLIGQALYYAAVTVGSDVANTPFSQELTLAGNDLKPYAPVQIGGYFSS